MWDLPGAGIEPVSPALADRFLTTGPQMKPRKCIFRAKNFSLCSLALYSTFTVKEIELLFIQSNMIIFERVQG